MRRSPTPQLRQKAVMDSNAYKRSLVRLRQHIEAVIAEREWVEFKRKTDEAISEINARIRSSR